MLQFTDKTIVITEVSNINSNIEHGANPNLNLSPNPKPKPHPNHISPVPEVKDIDIEDIAIDIAIAT
jgi:hypothetical protein